MELISSSPLDQFQIVELFKLFNLGGLDLYLTNSTLYMLIATVLAILLFFFTVREKLLIPNFVQSLGELSHNFVTNLILSNIGTKGLKHKNFIFTVFIFVLFSNLAGMLPTPLAFTTTSHFAVTFALAFIVFLYSTVLLIKAYKFSIVSFFIPSGVPGWLSPVMFCLEFITYCCRPMSLGIRLAANMIAGHIILEVIASFVVNMSLLFAPLSFIFIMVLIVFEVFIAILQSYIFALLTCVYLNDAFESH